MMQLTLVDWFYIVVALLAIGIAIFARITIRIAARPRWIRRALYLAVAMLIAAGTLFWTDSEHMHITGLLIVVLLLVFATWRQGLASWAVIAGLGSVRIWSALTQFELTPTTKKGQRLVVLESYVGSIVVSRLTFTQDSAEISAFLRQHVGEKKIIVNREG